MTLADEIVISTIKEGDTVEIVPIDKVPNCTRKFVVDEVTDEGFLFDVSETCDGYVIPFYWIKKIKKVSHK